MMGAELFSLYALRLRSKIGWFPLARLDILLRYVDPSVLEICSRGPMALFNKAAVVAPVRLYC